MSSRIEFKSMRLAQQGFHPKSFSVAQTGLTISLLNGWIAGLCHHAQFPKTFFFFLVGKGAHVAQFGLRLAMPRFPYH